MVFSLSIRHVQADVRMYECVNCLYAFRIWLLSGAHNKTTVTKTLIKPKINYGMLIYVTDISLPLSIPVYWYGVWRCAVGSLIPDVSKESSALIFMGEAFILDWMALELKALLPSHKVGTTYPTT